MLGGGHTSWDFVLARGRRLQNQIVLLSTNPTVLLFTLKLTCTFHSKTVGRENSLFFLDGVAAFGAVVAVSHMLRLFIVLALVDMDKYGPCRPPLPTTMVPRLYTPLAPPPKSSDFPTASKTRGRRRGSSCSK